MQVAMTEAFKMGLTVEEADAVFGRPMGIPKTGVFGLYDLIGLDLMADVLKSFIKELPKDDPFHEVAKENPLVTKLICEGYTGRKGKGGFYRINKDKDKKVLESINLKTGEYAPSKKIDLNKINEKLLNYRNVVQTKIINYAASLVPHVTEDHNNIDEAMRLGFNWTMGPFEMLHEMGINSEVNKENKTLIKFADILKEKYIKFGHDPKELSDWYGEKQLYLEHSLSTFRRIKHAVRINVSGPIKSKYERYGIKYKQHSAKLYSYNLINPGYTIAEFTTKANTLDYDNLCSLSKMH